MRNSSTTFPDEIDAGSIECAKQLCLGKFAQLRAVVVGDFMLDRYISGSVGRISPEAPVPVIKFTDEKFVPGGAGNVVANLVGLGVSVTVVGRVGKDAYGNKLLSLRAMKNVDTSLIVENDITTVKTRILGDGRQQILRLDHENFIETTEEDTKRIISGLSSYKDKIDCFIISDYGKGFCSPMLCEEIIKFCHSKKIPIFVDPKKNNWSCYKGATVITPNLRELRSACGENIVNSDEDTLRCGREMLKKYGIENILVTRSENGATLIRREGYRHVRAGKVEVYDVSGAGDTMLATTAAFWAAGLPLEDCVCVANAASQIVVGKVGTYSIKASDLLEAFNNIDAPYMNKIMDRNEAAEACACWKENKEHVIFTNGCFDIIHTGHIDSLNAARRLGDRLIVGLNSDDSVHRLKGNGRPVNHQDDRAKILASLESVDMVVIFDEDTPAELLSQLRPDVIAKGGDYKPEEVVGREYAGEVVIIPLTEGYSTTGIIEKMKRS